MAKWEDNYLAGRIAGIRSRFTICESLEETGEIPVGYELIKSYYDKGWYGKKSGRDFYEYE